MGASANHLDTSRDETSIDSEKLVEDVKNRFLTGLETLLDRMLNGADDTLFELAEKAETDELQKIYFQIMRMLRLQRTNITHEFNSALVESFKSASGETDNIASKNFSEDEKTRIDQGNIEEMVAISGMQTKAMQECHEQLLHFGKCIEFIAEQTPIVFYKESIEPKTVCEAFRRAIEPICENMDIQNKLILYKLFDRKLVSELGDIYNDINSLVTTAGVIPPEQPENLRQPVAGTNGTALRPEPEIDNSGRPNPPRSSDEYHYVQHTSGDPDVLDQRSAKTLNQYLYETKPGAPPEPPLEDQYFSKDDVLQGLSQLQASSDRTDNLDAGELKDALAQKIDKQDGDGTTREVSQLANKTIDLIALLFDTIVEDASMSETMKSLLLRLQIPLIKSALLDTELFSDPHHPSRKLLNVLANSNLRVSDPDDTLYSRLESIVDELVDNFDRDVVCFQIALDSLNELIYEKEVKSREAESQTQREVFKQHARAMVLKEIKQQVRGNNFPREAHNLVLRQWSTVMYQQYTNYGKESDQWFESIDTLKEIISHLQFDHDRVPVDDPTAKFSPLTQKLKTELLERKFNSDDVDDSLDQFVSARELVLKKLRQSEHISGNSSPVITDCERAEPDRADPCESNEQQERTSLTGPDNATDSTFSKPAMEFDLSGESTKDIATAMALGLADTVPELAMHNAQLETDVPKADKPAGPGEISSQDEEQKPDESGPLSVDSSPLDDDLLLELDLPDEAGDEVDSPATLETHTEKTEFVDPPPLDTGAMSPAEIFSVGSENAKNELPQLLENQPVIETTDNGAIDKKSVKEVLLESQDSKQNAIPGKLPEELKPGTWVNLYSGHCSPEIRAKLSVVIPETDTLIFVDREGFKSAERQIDNFLTELDEGLSSIVSEDSMFDKALSSVISNLRTYQ